MFTERTGVGLDVHARSAAAAAIDTVTGEVIERRLGGDYGSVVDLARRLEAGHGPLRITYEAGPTGFGPARDLAAAGLTVQVAAPSRLLRPAGQRVKTDRTDAMLLARPTINDDIVAVRVPTMSQESARDLVRARDDARADPMRARHRLSKMMLRRGWVYPGRTTRGPAHDARLRRIRANDVPALGSGAAAAFDDAYDAVAHAPARRDRLDEAITALAADSEFTATTTRPSCPRPISTLTGFAPAVEIGDWNRFTGATIASRLGLVPCEHSSGQTRSQGGITKTGNTHARRLLIESAWQHKPAYRPGPGLRAAWAKAPAVVAERADRGNRRPHRRWTALAARHKRHAVANTAIAREPAGWCWSPATMDAQPP